MKGRVAFVPCMPRQIKDTKCKKKRFDMDERRSDVTYVTGAG